MKYSFNNDRPIYIQLVEQLKTYIVSGKLEPNEKLPSVRELALILKINPNTVQKAMQELENDKLIYTERTNGKFVTKDIELIKKIQLSLANNKKKNFLIDMNNLGFSQKEAITYLKEEE